jgi:methyltransferase (TIGR00027 family)
MKLGKPSRTAWAAAAHRAAHQVLEQGRIFADPLALRILGGEAEAVVDDAKAQPSKRRMRLFVAIRTRFAEDAMAVAIGRGVRQVVVLGAGLDTYAYRNVHPGGLRLFEVDHPATQAWKRERLRNAAIQEPNSLTFAPIDFEFQTLAQGLASVGFDTTRRTFFTWLGVVPYLTEEAVWSTLGFIASLPNGAHVVFDYSDPPDTLSSDLRAMHDLRAQRVKTIGEPWLTYFETVKLRTSLAALGFSDIEDLGPGEIARRYFPNRTGTLAEKGGHVVHAAKT